jgi:4-hydroxy-tetrahydrodipicolinate synthase
MTPLFTGVAAALLSFFDDDGELQVEACARHAADLVDRGVRAIVVAGTTGEGPRLSRGERRELLAAVRGAIGPAVPVIAGTGAPDAPTAVQYTRDAVAGGADAVLVHPTAEPDPLAVFDAIAGDVPVLAYHFPDHYPPGIPMARLPELPVRGVKDSEGSAGRLLQEARGYGGEVYTGSAVLLHTAGLLGCTGAILAIANVAPEASIEAFAGSTDAFRRLMDTQLALGDQGIAGLKQLLAQDAATPTATRA